MVNATYFTYGGISSTTYGLTIANFTGLTPDSVEENEAFSPKLNVLKVPFSQRFYHGGVEYDSTPQCEFTVVSQNALTAANRNFILNWLVGRNVFLPLVFQGGTLSGYTYYCVFTSSSFVYVNGECHGLNLTASFDSPYARGTSTTASVSAGTVRITNHSSTPNTYTYPTITFTGSDISIINTTDDASRAFTFSGLSGAGTVTVDCEARTITSSTGKIILSNFTSKNWLRLQQGLNVLSVSGSGSGTITCPYYAMLGY